MDNGRYIWCRNCGAIHHVSAFDRSPVYAVAAGEVHEKEADDWRDFMNSHAGHRLEALQASGKSFFPQGLVFDSMNVAYVQVSNGEQTLLLRRSRSSIEEPFAYQIVEQNLLQSKVRLEIQAQAIRKEMQLHFSWAPAEPLTDEQISFFIAQFREVIQRIDAEALCATEYSDMDDQTSYSELPVQVIEELMDRCRGHFPSVQLTALREFVERHRDSSDVMALIKHSTVVLARSA